MVIRELTGDVYFGEPKGITTDATTGERVGFNNMIYSESEIKRIAKVSGVVWRGVGSHISSAIPNLAFTDSFPIQRSFESKMVLKQ